MKRWIEESRLALRGASDYKDIYKKIAEFVLVNLKCSDTPFNDYCQVCSLIIRNSDPGFDYLNQIILEDKPLRTALACHALIDDIPIITKSVRGFIRSLSALEGLEYNDALFDRVVAYETSRKMGFRLKTTLTTSMVSPQKLEELVMGANYATESQSEQATLDVAYYAIDLLLMSDDATLNVHEKLLEVVLDSYPPGSIETRQAQLAWGAISKSSQILNASEKLQLFGLYHALSKDWEFEFQGVGFMTLSNTRQWVEQSHLTPENLAHLTETEVQASLCRTILENPEEARRYVQALRGERLLEASIASDLGL